MQEAPKYSRWKQFLKHKLWKFLLHSKNNWLFLEINWLFCTQVKSIDCFAKNNLLISLNSANSYINSCALQLVKGLLSFSEFDKSVLHSLESTLERKLQELRGWSRFDKDLPWVSFLRGFLLGIRRVEHTTADCLESF